MQLTPYILCALRDVYDPETGKNIVDLGLVYGVAESPAGDVVVTMTLTTPNCAFRNYILGMAEAVVKQRVSDIRQLEIQLVWDPPWREDMVTPYTP